MHVCIRNITMTIKLSDQEIAFLTHLTDKELEAIVHIKKLSKQSQMAQAIAKKCAMRTQVARFHGSEAFLDLFNPISGFVMIMDSVFSLVVTMTVSAFIIFSTFFAVVLAALGITYFISTYKEAKQETAEFNQRYQLLALKAL